jgi:hypothetical protein
MTKPAIRHDSVPTSSQNLIPILMLLPPTSWSTEESPSIRISRQNSACIPCLPYRRHMTDPCHSPRSNFSNTKWSVRTHRYVHSPQQCFGPFWPSSDNTFLRSLFYFTARSSYTGQYITYGRGYIILLHNNPMPITVAERSKAFTVFACSEAGIMGSNSTQGMDFYCFCVCVRFSVFVYR